MVLRYLIKSAIKAVLDLEWGYIGTLNYVLRYDSVPFWYVQISIIMPRTHFVQGVSKKSTIP